MSHKNRGKKNNLLLLIEAVSALKRYNKVKETIQIIQSEEEGWRSCGLDHLNDCLISDVQSTFSFWHY